MTRKEDATLAKESDQNQKIQDMKARVDVINKTKPAMVVSIHQNSYHEEGIHGCLLYTSCHQHSDEMCDCASRVFDVFFNNLCHNTAS